MKVGMFFLRWSIGFGLSWWMGQLWGLAGLLWFRASVALLILGVSLEWLKMGWQGVGWTNRPVTMARVMRFAKQNPGRLWLGWGKVWGASELKRQVERGVLDDAGNQTTSAPFSLSTEQCDHLLVMGAPGSGKTQLFLWLSVQAIQRDEVLIFVDPKGGDTIPLTLRRAADQVGKICYVLRVGEPSHSVHLNVLGHVSQASELATRLCRLLPISEQQTIFTQFSWMALYRIVSGLLLLGHPLTFVGIRQHLLNQGDQLSREGVVLKGGEHPIVRGLKALARHDAVHYSKMVLSLMPLLEVLTSGGVGALLCEDATVPFVTLEQVVERRAVLYVGLGSLQDAQVARILGALVLGELSSWLGQRYRGGNHRAAKIQVMVDEAAEISGAAFIQLLNKGREAGLQMSLAVQTLADLEVALQGTAEARMMVGNAAHLLAFRSLDPESRRALIERGGSVRLRARSSGVSIRNSGFFGVRDRSDGVSLQRPWQEWPLLSEQGLSELKPLEYVGHFSGYGIVRGRISCLKVPRADSS